MTSEDLVNNTEDSVTTEENKQLKQKKSKTDDKVKEKKTTKPKTQKPEEGSAKESLESIADGWVEDGVVSQEKADEILGNTKTTEEISIRKNDVQPSNEGKEVSEQPKRQDAKTTEAKRIKEARRQARLADISRSRRYGRK